MPRLETFSGRVAVMDNGQRVEFPKRTLVSRRDADPRFPFSRDTFHFELRSQLGQTYGFGIPADATLFVVEEAVTKLRERIEVWRKAYLKPVDVAEASDAPAV
jgi:hypothetical protein